MIGCLNIVLFKHQRYSVSLTLYKNIWVLTKNKKNLAKVLDSKICVCNETGFLSTLCVMP